MHRIKKIFKGYPFAHRQPTHDGHCKLIHGHNWDFEIVLEADRLDENGFVYDFGRFGWLKEWFNKMFDHTCLINSDDPNLPLLRELGQEGLMDLIVVGSCSSEGIAKMIYQKIENNLEVSGRDSNSSTGGRGVRLVSVTVYEDYKNSATYSE